MAKILITGGSGLIGTHLSKHLTDNNHDVVHLSRNPSAASIYKTYKWNVKEQYLDPEALNGIDHIIHLAGAGVADKRWTAKRKQVILSSRVDSANLLFEEVRKANIQLKSFISASGINYYGSDTGDQLMKESDPVGDGFLAEVVNKWEQAADQFNEITQVTKLRTGIVLSTEGGALPLMALPVKLFVGAPVGSGKQYLSWIHIRDLTRMYAFVLEKQLTGVFNAVTPNPVTNKEFNKNLARTLRRPLFLPNVPGIVLKIILGELSQTVLGGNRISAGRFQEMGFEYDYPELNQALNELYER